MQFLHPFILILSLLAFSCAPKIRHFENYEKQFLTKAHYMPTKENLNGIAPKMVVFALDENNNEAALSSGLGESLAGDIENVISKNHLGEIVDRKAAQKLQKEIALAEMNGTGSYKGPIVADYAISGTITNAGFTSKYSSGFFYPDPSTGHIITVPPKYTYSTDIAGNLKIYELPSLQVVHSIAFNDVKNRKENVQQDGGFAWGGLKIGGKTIQGAQKDDNLLRKTGRYAIENIEVDIKNFFAKKGYILEKRVYKKKTIFKISLGSLDGIKHGDLFEITGKYDAENPITLESEIERRIITTGVVSDKIDPETSWVIIKNPKKINAVRLGDTVKIKYEKSKFSDLTNAVIDALQ